MRLFPLLLACSALLYADVLDRVAVSVGTHVITESQIVEEIKLDAFLNNEPPSFTEAAKRAAADRLIEQLFVRKEMEMGHYPQASPEEASAMLQKLLATRARGKDDFDQQLHAAGITINALEQHLLWGLTLSHFIDVRFRPAVQVTRRDVQKYYQEHIVPGAAGKQAPSLEDVRSQIEQTLTAQRSDEQLDTWLKDTRAHTNIRYHKEVFGTEGTE
jgi:hypothetical protein